MRLIVAHCQQAQGHASMTGILRSISLFCTALLCVVPLSYAEPAAAEPTAEQFATALVTIESSINPDGHTVATLGDKRTGTGVVIDSSGLMVTVGYLLLEATEVTVTYYNGVRLPATVMANDRVSGLALLRVMEAHADDQPSVTPVKPGQSSRLAIDERVVVLPAGGLETAASVRVHSIREFSAPWEYLLERAIYTMPPVRNFSGAALINRDAELVGIGSLALRNIAESDTADVSGNLFIPVDLFAARLGVMLSANGSDAQELPWLGVMTDESLAVTRVLDNSPAMIAGIQADDSILGINDIHVRTRERLYRSLWTEVSVGDEMTLLVARTGKLISIAVKPAARSSWLRTDSEQ